MATVVSTQTVGTNRGTAIKTITELSSTYQTILGSAGVVYYVKFVNTGNSGAASYIKFWDNATPTVGTTAPHTIIMAPASDTAEVIPVKGINHATAITAAALTTGGTGGTTAPTNAVNAIIHY